MGLFSNGKTQNIVCYVIDNALGVNSQFDSKEI